LAEACWDFVYAHIEGAKNFFRNLNTFHDSASYRHAHNTIKRAMDIVSAAYHPLDMRFNELNFHRITSWQSIQRFTADPSINPFLTIIRESIIPKLPRSASVYGISVTYRTQLGQAFTFARWIRKLRPDAKIILGGAYLTAKRRGIIGHGAAFRDVDAYVFGEGETPLLKLVELAMAGRSFPSHMTSVYLPQDGKKTEDFDLSLLNFEDFDTLPTPDYQGLDLGQYFSPKPVFFLSNARGCYWRKCAFCAISCATGRTFRQRSIDNLRSDIDTLIDRYGAEHIFFADDCIPTKRLREIADHCRCKKRLYWQTEARYEGGLTLPVLQSMFDGGCRQLTFGNESGSQRILNVMQKGTAVEENERIIKDAHRARIAVHLQNFVGFPSETREEAMQTIDQLVRLRRPITSFALGPFHLTEDSLCERNPDRFGIVNVRFKKPGDLDALRLYDVDRGISQRESRDLAMRLRSKLMGSFPHNDFFLDGPAGAHIMFYLERQKKRGKWVFPFPVPNPKISELMVTNVRVIGDEIAVLPGPERNLTVVFHHKTGECIPVKTKHFEFIRGLDETRSVMESVAEKTWKGRQFDVRQAASYLLFVYDMLTKGVLMRC
jgi:hypothetical protein